MPSRAAFTLIELLVVITIITVLLSMLVPAMDKARYTAALAACAAQQRGMSQGVSQYAFDNKRHYPYLKFVHSRQYHSPPNYIKHIGNDRPNDTEPTPDRATPIGGGYDYRPLIDSYHSLKYFADPLAGEADYGYDANDWDANVLSSYQHWGGWQYYSPGKASKHAKGMLHVGDRLIYLEPVGNRRVPQRFNLLVSDRATFGTTAGMGHNDHQGSGQLLDRQNSGFGDEAEGSGVTQWKGTYTHYHWPAANVESIGTFDMNFGFQDGSVQQVKHLSLPPIFTPHSRGDYPLTPVPPNNEVSNNGRIGGTANWLLSGG